MNVATARPADNRAGALADRIAAAVGGDGRADEAEGWPAVPDLPGPPDPVALPVEALPPALRAHVLSVADALQVPAGLPALLSLGCVSAAAAGRVEVDVRAGWREPVGIYTGCILPPASRKSPCYAAMTAPVREWEGEQIREAAPAYVAALDAAEVATKRLDKAKNDAATGKADAAAVIACRRDLETVLLSVPRDGRLLCGDITPEAMVLRMAAQGGRLALLEPEPGPLQLLAGRYSDTARLDELKKAWSSEAIIVDRVGRPPLRVERPSLTLCLCLQTGVVEALPHGGAWRGEGALARFLWCMPPHGLGARLTGAAMPPLDVAAAQEYGRVLRRLLDLPAGDDGPRALTLSPAGRDVLHAFEAEVELRLADGGAFEEMRDWAGKAVGQSVRVAALLALARRAETGADLWRPVDAESMTGAVALLRALATHALRLLVVAGDDGRTADLRYLLRRLQALPQLATVRALREATRGRVSIAGAVAVNDLLADLAARGCARVVPRPSAGGHPPSPVVELHPALRGEPETEVEV